LSSIDASEALMASRQEILWHQTIVGWVENLSCDNLHLFGRWLPASGVATREFLEQLRAETPLEIQIGREGMRAWLDSEPDDEIEMNCLPGPRPPGGA
jgi:hypothetical protein